MIAIGNSNVSDDVIKIDANINEGHICYFKIAHLLKILAYEDKSIL